MRAEQLADTVNRVCASRWARRGRLLSSRPPGGALPRGGRGGGTRASEHREATDCAPGTRDQETRQPQPSGARPGRRDRHALQRDHALYSPDLHEAPTVRWRPALPRIVPLRRWEAQPPPHHLHRQAPTVCRRRPHLFGGATVKHMRACARWGPVLARNTPGAPHPGCPRPRRSTAS